MSWQFLPCLPSERHPLAVRPRIMGDVWDEEFRSKRWRTIYGRNQILDAAQRAPFVVSHHQKVVLQSWISFFCHSFCCCWKNPNRILQIISFCCFVLTFCLFRNYGKWFRFRPPPSPFPTPLSLLQRSGDTYRLYILIKGKQCRTESVVSSVETTAPKHTTFLHITMEMDPILFCVCVCVYMSFMFYVDVVRLARDLL